MSIEIPESLAEIRRIVKGSVDAIVGADINGTFIVETWTGPRSMEIGMRLRDGREVKIVVMVKEVSI